MSKKWKFIILKIKKDEVKLEKILGKINVIYSKNWSLHVNNSLVIGKNLAVKSPFPHPFGI